MNNKEAHFDQVRKVTGSVLGPLCAVLLWLMPIQGIGESAHHLLAVMSMIAIWWITEPVPIPVTSLLGPTLCVVLGIAPIGDAFEQFANPMIFLFMGGFLLAKAMMVNGMDKRIAYGIMSMKWVGESPRRIFLAITIDLASYKYATGLMLMTAYACSIGGVMTPIGTPPNIIMIGFLNQLAPQAPSVTFFQWMVWGVVAMVCYFVLAYVVLWRMFPADVKHIDGAREYIRSYVDSLGPWTRAQKNTMIAFSVAIILWVAPSVLSVYYGPHSDVMKFYDSHFPEAIAAMTGGLLLFFLPTDLKKGEMTMSWKDGVEGIEWGTLILFGGGLAMGSLMYTTGLSAWIGTGIKEALGGNPSEWLFVTVFCGQYRQDSAPSL